MNRTQYDECHGPEEEVPERDEPYCTICGRDLFADDQVFEINDKAGHDIICMNCLKKMSIGDLADLFGAVLTKVRDL